MAGRIRIAALEEGGLFFSIEDAQGRELERSAPYRSICRVESALASLLRAAEAATPPNTRNSQRHSEAALAAARGAMVSDERPQGRRRTDLTGPLARFRSHGAP
jgi:hypothetical protein